MASSGFTPREIDEMYWPDVQELLDYWLDHPPAHILIAGYLGYERPSPAQVISPEQMASLLRGQ